MKMPNKYACDTSVIFNGMILSLTRGSINGYIKKLQNLSTLEISPNPEDKKEKTITISYLGIAFFLQNLYNKVNSYE